LGTTESKIKKGVLLKYIRSVSSASTGCVTDNRSNYNLKINSKTLKWIPFDFELKFNFNVGFDFFEERIC
jgi:hypothetical protein